MTECDRVSSFHLAKRPPLTRKIFPPTDRAEPAAEDATKPLHALLFRFRVKSREEEKHRNFELRNAISLKLQGR